jgi:hypothetical protein
VPGTQQFSALPAKEKKEETILQTSLQDNTEMELKHGG